MNHTQYDVVFVGADLDDMSVETFMDSMCCAKAEPDVLILVDPASQEQEDREWGKIADGFVYKPVQLERLRRVILKIARKE